MKHIVIGKANHMEALRLQERFPLKIVLAAIVMALSIELDHLSLLMAVEINDKLADHVLTAEL